MHLSFVYVYFGLYDTADSEYIIAYLSQIDFSFYWLTVISRIEFKILLLTYQGLSNQTTFLLKHLIVTVPIV